MKPSQGGRYVPSLNFIMRSRPCPCWYLTDLYVICCHFIALMLLFQCHAAGRNFTPTEPLLCGNPGLPPDLSFYIPNILGFFVCIYSKHHKSFDPFQEQKETSFKELQSSAESLAQFLCEAIETTSVNSGDGGGAIKSVFDTLLQVRKFVRKEVRNLICSLSDI